MPKMRNTVLGLLLASVILAAPVTRAAAAGRIDTGDQYPVVGKETIIHVRDSSGRLIEGALIDITYRPESQVEKLVSLGATNQAGIVRWTPEDAGVVTIAASWTENDSTVATGTRNVSVRFASLPVNGLAIMILAGLLLLGGSAVHFIRLLREPDAG